MSWPVQQKQISRNRILQSAIRLFSSRGFDGVSIADVMRDADLTHGAFYAHFKSKQQLYAEAIDLAASDSFSRRHQYRHREKRWCMNSYNSTWIRHMWIRVNHPVRWRFW
ncbi:TetR/AcrR family transcriptional regulator [Mariprofundus erugo]|uniref:TetR/AcrR family transcriptional regulator n=1 Tax=Mariprofundus erugo TaxID=2528639 RepID=UPI0013866B25